MDPVNSREADLQRKQVVFSKLPRPKPTTADLILCSGFLPCQKQLQNIYANKNSRRQHFQDSEEDAGKDEEVRGYKRKSVKAAGKEEVRG